MQHPPDAQQRTTKIESLKRHRLELTRKAIVEFQATKAAGDQALQSLLSLAQSHIAAGEFRIAKRLLQVTRLHFQVNRNDHRQQVEQLQTLIDRSEQTRTDDFRRSVLSSGTTRNK